MKCYRRVLTSLNVGGVVFFLHCILGIVWFLHVLLVYWTTFHVPLRYIERYFTYSIIYRKASCVWLCIRRHYYWFELPRTLSISGDPTRIPYPSEKIPLAVLFGAIHRKQHSGRLLCTYPRGIREWHLLENPSERPEFWTPPVILSLLVLTYSLCREVFLCVF